MKKHNETINSDFEGTIIDLETFGAFDRNFSDSRQYAKVKPVIFGYIDRNTLSIHNIDDMKSISELNEMIHSLVIALKKPFYAFNCDFEMGVLFHSLNREVHFERELNAKKYEKKESVVSTMEIPQYGDPFQGDGKACMNAWINGEIDKAIAHNRSCLLKERDILLKRGFRTPDGIQFVKSD